ncbi:hypothetical protein K2X30_13135 [bacterium]|nr:hypothetical protein [bacterium]
MSHAKEVQRIHLYPGYLTKVACAGRLLASGVGNENLVRREALPKDLGCGIWLVPLVSSGSTNLILETSAGSIEVLVDVVPASRQVQIGDLKYEFKGDTK